MKLRMSARKGHYNLCDPSEETVSVHMDLPNGKYINIDFPTDDNCVDWIDDPRGWADTAIQLIDRWDKRVWISTQREEVKAFRALIVENEKAINTQRLKDAIEEKRAKMLRLGEQIADLEKDLLELLSESLAAPGGKGKFNG